MAAGLLFLLIAVSGCALQRIDDKVANNGRDIHDLRGEIGRLENRINRDGDKNHLAELQNRIDQLVRSVDDDSQKLQELKTSVMVLSKGLRDQDQVLRSVCLEQDSKRFRIAYEKALEAVTKELREYGRTTDRATAALSAYVSAVKEETRTLDSYNATIRALHNRLAASADDETNAKTLEIVAGGGFGVAAIFFGFLGLAISQLLGMDVKTEIDKIVAKIYRVLAIGNACGVLFSIATSIVSIFALQEHSKSLSRAAIVLGCIAAALVVGLTVYLLRELLRKKWTLPG